MFQGTWVINKVARTRPGSLSVSCLLLFSYLLSDCEALHWDCSTAASARSGLRLALPSSIPSCTSPATLSCTFPTEGKFPAWPGLPAAPEFPVFEEAAGREKGAVCSKAWSRGRRGKPPQLLQMHSNCACGRESGASIRGSRPCGETMSTRLASDSGPCP